MRRFITFPLQIAIGLAASFSIAGVNVPSPDKPLVTASVLAGRPLTFEQNLGQYGAAAAFVSRGPNYLLALRPTEVQITLQRALGDSTDRNSPDRIVPGAAVRREFRTLRIQLVGANAEANLSGEAGVASRANYFRGNDPTQWRTGVPAFQRVRTAQVYPGVDLIHYGNQHRLEYDFEIAPEADPAPIALRFFGADDLTIDPQSGDLVVKIGTDGLRQPKPVIYQRVRGEKKVVDGGYVFRDATTVGFSLGEYDHKLPLVIDPVVSYSTIFGGPGADDTFWAIAVDAAGSIYVAGETVSPELATPGAFQTNLAGILAGHGDVVLEKFSNQLDTKPYATYLGGSAYEAAFGLAVDGAGNAYLTGYTGSTNFPTRNAIQTNLAGSITPGYTTPPLDAFVAEVDASGSNLVFSTFLGGSADDIGQGIALDSATNIVVVGQTISTNFPTSNTTNTGPYGLEDAFVVKLGPKGTNVIYSTCLGGTSRDIARGVAISPAGNPVIVGFTSSTEFPVTTNAYQRSLNNTTNFSANEDAFLCELDPNTAAITYATYLGGLNNDRAIRVAEDASGAAYVAGWTLSTDFPWTSTNLPAFVLSNSLYADVFVTKLVPGQSNITYSALFGGSGRDQAWDVAVDQHGFASVVGETASADFPTNAVSGILRRVNSGGVDAFIAQLNPAGDALVYSSYLGSEVNDYGYGVALDQFGNAYYLGRTASANFPTQPTYFSGSFTDQAGFIVKVLGSGAPALNVARSSTNVLLSWSAAFPEFSLQANTNLTATNSWQSLSTTPLATNQNLQVTVPATNSLQFFRLVR